METKKLNVIETIIDGFEIGVKNLPSLILTVLLYVLTVWIPYLNLGTTIALQTLPGRLAKGEVISPLYIFESHYRKDFSSFLLLYGCQILIFYVALCFFIIPAFVVSIALSLAFYILIDDDCNAIEAMKRSNNATYGNKWNIFFVSLAFTVLSGFVVAIFLALTYKMIVLCVLLFIIWFLLVCAVGQGINSSIYRQLYLERNEEEEAVQGVEE